MTLTIYVVLHYMADFKPAPLEHIFEKLYLSSRIAWWQILLAEYDIVYMVIKTVKGSVITYHLAENAIEDYEPLNFYFPNEDVLIIEKGRRTGLVDNVFWWSSKCIRQ